MSHVPTVQRQVCHHDTLPLLLPNSINLKNRVYVTLVTPRLGFSYDEAVAFRNGFCLRRILRCVVCFRQILQDHCCQTPLFRLASSLGVRLCCQRG